MICGLFLFLCAVHCGAAADLASQDHELGHHLNTKWQASVGRHSQRSALGRSAYNNNNNNGDNKDEEPLPTVFDARDAWPFCESIGRIADQGFCDWGDWAVAAASAISDRICIHSRQMVQVRVSAANIMECEPHSRGCYGGAVESAYDYYVKQGVVSGGDYGDNTTCQPYPYPPDHAVKLKACHTKCDNPDAEPVVFKGQSYYKLPVDEEAIQREIFKNGPVTARIALFSDWYDYRHGVYEQRRGTRIGWHVVRLLGWGELEGRRYWLAADSRGPRFGNAGLVRVARGDDQVGIELHVYAALPAPL